MEKERIAWFSSRSRWRPSERLKVDSGSEAKLGVREKESWLLFVCFSTVSIFAAALESGIGELSQRRPSWTAAASLIGQRVEDCGKCSPDPGRPVLL